MINSETRRIVTVAPYENKNGQTGQRACVRNLITSMAVQKPTGEPEKDRCYPGQYPHCAPTVQIQQKGHPCGMPTVIDGRSRRRS